jgi:hypothetical protein
MAALTKSRAMHITGAAVALSMVGEQDRLWDNVVKHSRLRQGQ